MCFRATRSAPALLLPALLAGCGGEPPRGLGGIELGMTQQEVLEVARDRGGFTCRIVGTRPRLALCDGPTAEGLLGVVVRDDSVVRITLRVDARAGEDSREGIVRFVRPFGDPAWRDRPQPPRVTPPEAFHTLWLDTDSTRGLAMLCAGRRLEPPCTAELVSTFPARVQAQLDTLLGIRR